MENMQSWIALTLGVFSILGAVAGLLAWASRWLLNAIDAGMDTKFAVELAPINARLDRLDRRMDAFDTKLDHVAEVVDLRLKPVEEDMALVKRHLLGSPAA